MKYLVRIGDEDHEVLLDGEGVHIDGEDVAAHVEQIDGTPVRMVTVGNEVHRVVVRPGASRGLYTLWLDGYRFESRRSTSARGRFAISSGRSAGPTGPAPLKAPMPGLIVRVNVQVGDLVQAGRGSSHGSDEDGERAAGNAAGKVKSIVADPGTAVEKGALLIELE